MINLESILGKATQKLLEPQYDVAVARHKGIIYWLLVEQDFLILDWEKWRNSFVLAGCHVPDENVSADERGGLIIINENTAEDFLSLIINSKFGINFLKQSLLERFEKSESWWDVSFLFPIAFIDFDNKRFAGFYYTGARLERYVPDGLIGEFVDFSNTYPEDVFPKKDKFWVVDDRDLLYELNERGRKSSDSK